MKHANELKLHEVAKAHSQTITIRTYENGCSQDKERKATKAEQAILCGIIFGSLLSINSGSDLDSIKSNAEYIGNQLLPGTSIKHMNGYHSIYMAIDNCIAEIDK
jgi:hypothetical protein